MKVIRSVDVPPAEASPEVAALLGTIDGARLRAWVERIAAPRHLAAEPERNRATANWLRDELLSMGYRVERQGELANILALPRTAPEAVILVGAHYDSVPECPGADDNGSAVAAMLGCAAALSLLRPAPPVVFAAFNGEEDGLLGSRDFVGTYLPRASFTVRCAHVLEMVGFASARPGSQRVPAGLPIELPDRGDFLGLLANGGSRAVMDLVLRRAGAHVPELPVAGACVPPGVEAYLPVLERSDHAPFWSAGIPAVMWTDTAEFRNPHYHRPTDTPDTLDYGFLLGVTRLLAASVLEQGGG